MSNHIYIAVGSVFFSKKGKAYLVIPETSCANCAFRNKPKSCEKMSCLSITREDKTKVIFVRQPHLENKNQDSQ